jgi:2'-5' RNA ligase
VHPDDLHLTLCFIGALPASRIDEVAAAMRAVATRHAGCMLNAHAVSGWPRAAPRLLVVEFDAAPALAALVTDLSQSLAALRLPIERRRFRPHVTLACSRHGSPAPCIAADAVEVPPMTVATLGLYRSDPRVDAARYTRLADARLEQ